MPSLYRAITLIIHNKNTLVMSFPKRAPVFHDVFFLLLCEDTKVGLDPLLALSPSRDESPASES
jgi:hypothetical protein